MHLDSVGPEDGLEEEAKMLLSLPVAVRTFTRFVAQSPAASSLMPSEMKGRMGREEALARLKWRRGNSSSETATLSGPGFPTGKLPSKLEDKGGVVNNMPGGVSSQLRTRNSPIDVDSYNINLPPDFLAAKA